MDLHIEYIKCHHGVDKRHFCTQCQDEQERYKSLLFKKSMEDNRVPIRRGCPNHGSLCFCSGACQEVVGYRDKMPHEFDPSINY